MPSTSKNRVFYHAAPVPNCVALPHRWASPHCYAKTALSIGSLLCLHEKSGDGLVSWVCLVLEIGWFTICPQTVVTSCDSAELCMNSGRMTRLGVPWGETLTKLLFPRTSMNQQCWKTSLKLWFCSQLPLCFCRVSGEPGHSPIKAIAATEAVTLQAQEDGSMSIYSFCKFVKLNHRVRISVCASKSAPKLALSTLPGFHFTGVCISKMS